MVEKINLKNLLIHRVVVTIRLTGEGAGTQNFPALLPEAWDKRTYKKQSFISNTVVLKAALGRGGNFGYFWRHFSWS